MSWRKAVTSAMELNEQPSAATRRHRRPSLRGGALRWLRAANSLELNAARRIGARLVDRPDREPFREAPIGAVRVMDTVSAGGCGAGPAVHEGEIMVDAPAETEGRARTRT